MRKFSQSVTALRMQLTLAVDREWTGSAALLPNDVPTRPSSDDTPQCGPIIARPPSSTLPPSAESVDAHRDCAFMAESHPVVKHLTLVPWDERTW
jgi:hypothetical protein